MIAILLGLWHYAAALILVAGALAAIAYLPGKFGGIVGAVLGAAAAGVVAYQLGFHARGKLDQTEELRAQVAALEQNAKDQKAVADAATIREQQRAKEHDNDQQQISDYLTALAKANSDVALSNDELGRLRSLIDVHQAKSARAAADVRSARGSSLGCKATLARYIGSLNEANRRLVDDAQFYCDVRDRFSSTPCR